MRSLVKVWVEKRGFSRKDVEYLLGKAVVEPAAKEGYSQEDVQCYLATVLEAYPFTDGGPLAPMDDEDWDRVAKICCDAGIPMDAATLIKKNAELDAFWEAEDAFLQAETGEGSGIF